MKKYLLPHEGSFYKANLHVHTTVSDGAMSPEEIKKIYKQQGYSVVAFTDHEIMVPHSELTDENFLALTSTEISVNQRCDCDFCYTKTYHLNIYSPEENRSCFSSFDRSKMWLKHSFDYITKEQERQDSLRLYTTESVNEVIKKANDEGCLVSYNHPVWSLQDYTDYIDLEGLWGIELYNTACVRMGYPDSPKPMEDLLRRGRRVFPLATDDAHRHTDCFGGFVMIKAESLTYDNIFSALKSGDFYASTGPQFCEIFIENGVVNISTSPVSSICISTDCRYTFYKNANESLLTGAKIDINDFLRRKNEGVNEHQYFRITLVDEKGNAAFTRAYFLDELDL